MPRLVHDGTGVLINVDEATAANLGSGWYPQHAPAPPKTRRPRRANLPDEADPAPEHIDNP